MPKKQNKRWGIRFCIATIAIFLSIAAQSGIESIGGNIGNYRERRSLIPPDGYMLCDKCSGNKTVECISCKGNSRGRKCIRCERTGIVKCGKCNGTGYVKKRNLVTPKSQWKRRELSEAIRQTDRKVLKQKLKIQKDYLRNYVRENDIVCTSRVQLAEMNLALIQKCRQADQTMKNKLKANGFDIKFTTDTHLILGAEADSSGNEKYASIIVFSEQSLHELLKELKQQHSRMKTELEKDIANPEYYKKFCDVHKWDDECCPRFGADYFTEDMKTKYASNKMKAYEMEKNGVITCTCTTHLLKYQAAQKKYNLEVLTQKRAILELSNKYLELHKAIVSFHNDRIEEEHKLKAMEKADEFFATITDLVKSLKSL